MHFSQGDDKTETSALTLFPVYHSQRRRWAGTQGRMCVCQAWTSAEKTCLTRATPSRLPAHQRRCETSLLLSLPIPRLRQHSRRGVVEKKEVLRGKREKEIIGTHLPLGDDFVLPLNYRDALPPQRCSPRRQRVRVDIFWQSTCRNIHGVFAARTGRISFFSGRGVGREGVGCSLVMELLSEEASSSEETGMEGLDLGMVTFVVC